MKKVVMLSAAAILGMSSIVASQAEEVASPEASAEVATQDAASTDTASDAQAEQPADEATDTEAGDEAASEEEAAAPEEEQEPIPQDTPQVQKLIELYPNLVARIRPYGRVCFQGETCDVTVTATGPSADGKPRDGEAVYNAICHTCHEGGLLGAPKFGDAGAWGPRIAQGKDTLYDHAIHGIGAMPAKGGADIPDEEVENAVNYMVEHSS